MRRYALGVLGVWLVAGATLFAADFWVEKPFLDWSDKDAQTMLTDSPWASTAALALPPPPPRPADEGGRGGGGDGFGPDARRVRVTISWRSALPVKQAVVRTGVGQGGTVSDEQRAFLAAAEQFHVLALIGLPPQYATVGPNSKIEATLERKDKEDILAVDRTSQRGTAGPVLLLAFPRGGITADDREVELVVKIDRLTVKRKFKLTEMMFDGQLAL